VLVVITQQQRPVRSTSPGWLGWLAAVVGVVVVLFGTWVTGALLTQDATVAMVLTGGWFMLAVAAVAAALWFWRRAALPAFVAVVLTVVATGGWLGYSSTMDKVVDENVITAPSPDATTPTPDATAPTDGGGGATGNGGSGGDGGNQSSGGSKVAATGTFVRGAHPTRGTATVVDVDDDKRVLTLTGFRTDPGPDLRVVLVPAGARGVDGGIDIGALKGNKGNQQYSVPANAPLGAVVIWCRAFSVEFGTAKLSRPAT